MNHNTSVSLATETGRRLPACAYQYRSASRFSEPWRAPVGRTRACASGGFGRPGPSPRS